MIAEASLAPANSLLLIMDPDADSIPESMGAGLVAATPSCIAVGTLSEDAGETHIRLTNERAAVSGPEMQRVFRGVLETPGRQVQVCTVLLEPVVSLPVPGVSSHVEIWADHPTEPRNLRVLVDA